MTSEEIFEEIRAIFRKRWTTREGRAVPDAEDVGLGNDGVNLTGAVLYADMTDSTELVNRFRPSFAAEIYKAYLLGACRVIRSLGGEITAFDGDRVMAVFVGERKNSTAVKAALQINYLVGKTNELIREGYPTTAYSLRHTIGIDVSDLFVARTGIRNSNDLVWVGRAANYAAKLAGLGDADFPTYITDAVFATLSKEAKYGGQKSKLMWERRMWSERQVIVHRSSWRWRF
jgi:class 3 adenylate cyclase